MSVSPVPWLSGYGLPSQSQRQRQRQQGDRRLSNGVIGHRYLTSPFVLFMIFVCHLRLINHSLSFQMEVGTGTSPPSRARYFSFAALLFSYTAGVSNLETQHNVLL